MKRADNGERQLNLLNRALSGDGPSLEDIQALLADGIGEDLHLDYKGPEIVDADAGKASPGKPVDVKAKLRKYVAGFANGDGGVLVLGVSEPPKVSDASGRESAVPGGRRAIRPLALSVEAAAQTARDALQPLVSTGQVLPRIRSIPVESGTVLVIAVPRADGVVYCTELQQAVFYVRLHDSTVHAPAYLIEDLVLGRRRHPQMSVSLGVPAQPQWRDFHLRLTVDNVGLVFAEDARLLLLGYGPPEPLKARKPSAALLERARVVPRPGHLAYVLVDHDAQALGTLGPFDRCVREVRVAFPALGQGFWWGAVVCLASKGSPPSWTQLVVYADMERKRAWSIPLGSRRGVVAVHDGGAFGDKWKPSIDWFEPYETAGNKLPENVLLCDNTEEDGS